jgi:MtN3 and saliva related transmembrane protein
MNAKTKEAMGTIAGCLTTGSFIPQVYTVWHRAPHPAPDVSLGMFSIISLGVLLWIVYGFILHAKPLIIFNAVTFCLSGSVLAYKLIYG